jgi:hypothetical protein
MNLKGTLIEIFDTQNVSDRFSKREFVLEYADNPQYPQVVKFEVTQDRCGMLDEFKVGEEVDVQFNVRGRAWTNPQGAKQYFNTLQAWRIDRAAAAAPPNNAPAGAPQHNAPPAEDNWMTADSSSGTFSSDTDDDLPF